MTITIFQSKHTSKLPKVCSLYLSYLVANPVLPVFTHILQHQHMYFQDKVIT